MSKINIQVQMTMTGKSNNYGVLEEKMAGENLYNIIIEGSLRAVNRTRKLK